MSRLAFKNNLQQALASAASVVVLPVDQLTKASFHTALDQVDETCATMSQEPVARAAYVQALYARMIADKTCEASVSNATKEKVALAHALCHLPRAIMCGDAADMVGLVDGAAAAAAKQGGGARINVFCDHSASMNQAAAYPMMMRLVETLRAKEARTDATIRIYPFGDHRHELGRALSVGEYAMALQARHLVFNGGCTELNPAWQLAARLDAGADNVSIIVSDGEFTGRFRPQDLVQNPGVRGIIFYAPPWSPAMVTKKHSAVLASKIPESAVYDGSIAPGHIEQLDTALDNMVGASIAIELPGRERIGAISLPTRLLQPSGLHKALRQAALTSAGEAQGAVQFMTRLAQVYDQLYESGRQDIERCFASKLFDKVMSLNPTASKFCEALLGGSGEFEPSSSSSPIPQPIKNAFAVLFLAVKRVQDLVSSEYAKLLQKYKGDVAKCAAFEALMQRATTVSERQTIFEFHVRERPVAQVVFPSCKSLDALASLFHRLKTVHAGPELPVLDHMLVALFRGARLEPVSAATLEDELAIPVWRLKLHGKAAFEAEQEGEEKKEDVEVAPGGGSSLVDVLTLIRLFPAYYRQQQQAQGQKLCADFTFQPKASKRIACLLQVAQLQGANFPAWLSASLARQVRLDTDASLVTDADDENLSAYWMHVLRQLGSKHGLADADRARIDKRLAVHSCKRFLLREVKECVLQYQVPMYPDAPRPFLEVDDAAAYCAFSEPVAAGAGGAAVGAFVDPQSGRAKQRARVLTSKKEIDAAYDRNYHENGAYLRPLHMTGGQIVLWHDAGPTAAQMVRDHLERAYPNETPAQLDSHMHLLQDQQPVTVCEFGAANVRATCDAIREQLRRAPPLLETKTTTVPAAYFMQDLVRTWLPLQQAAAEADGGVSGIFAARALQGIAAFGKADRANYTNEIDFCLAVAEGTLPEVALAPALLEFPLAPVALNNVPGLSDRLEAMHQTCARYLSDSTHPPLLLGSASEFITTPVALAQAASAASSSSSSSSSASSASKALALGECPIGLEVMVEPVSIVPCGHSFCNPHLKPVLASGRTTCPMCNTPVASTVVNYALRDVLAALGGGGAAAAP